MRYGQSCHAWLQQLSEVLGLSCDLSWILAHDVACSQEGHSAKICMFLSVATKWIMRCIMHTVCLSAGMCLSVWCTDLDASV